MGLFGTLLGFPSSFGDAFSGGGITTQFMKQYGKDQAAYQDPINANNLKWTRKSRQTAWTDTVQGMRDANINPALAYGSGPVASDMAPTQAQAENPLMQMLNLGTQAGAIGKQRAETKEITEEAELKRQQQDTEQTKRDLMSAQTLLTGAEKTIKDNEASWFDKNQAVKIKNVVSDTVKNNALTNEIRSQIDLNRTVQELKQAETRYTDEKSRGYLDSGSFSGFGISGSYTKSGNQGVQNNKQNKKWKFKKIEYYDPQKNKVITEYVKI